MARETVAAKAVRYLAEGRIVVTDVSRRHVHAVVRGEGARYSTEWHAGAWSCTCPHVARTTDCCHVVAMKRITVTDIEEAHR